MSTGRSRLTKWVAVSRLVWTLRRLASFLRPEQLRRTITIWRRIKTAQIAHRTPRTRRAARAVLSVLRRPAADGPIWAVGMMKNEEDVLEETVRNLIAQGVDHVLVADNVSTDSTETLLRKLATELPVSVVHDPIPHLWQGDKTSHLARTATRLGASWIVPFDADEIWKGLHGKTIRETLHSTEADIAEATWWNYMPLTATDDRSWQARFPYREREPDPQIKVAFRANWLARLTAGNHSVFVPGGRSQRLLRIAHFRYRSASQMLRKANDGAKAARLAGFDDWTHPQWARLEGKDEVAALEVLQQLASSGELVHDPAEAW